MGNVAFLEEGHTRMSTDITGSHTDREIVEDRTEALRLLDNMTVVSWDIQDDELTNRETKRLDTIRGKIQELRDIVYEREMKEFAENK